MTDLYFILDSAKTEWLRQKTLNETRVRMKRISVYATEKRQTKTLDICKQDKLDDAWMLFNFLQVFSPQNVIIPDGSFYVQYTCSNKNMSLKSSDCWSSKRLPYHFVRVENIFVLRETQKLGDEASQ